MIRSRLVVSIGKICQEFASGILPNTKVTVLLKMDFNVGYP